MNKQNIIRLILMSTIGLLVYFLLSTPFSHLLIQGFGIIIAGLTALWLLSLAIKDSSIIDIYWGFGFVLVILFYLYALGDEFHHLRNYIIAAMVTLWGLRLTIHLGIRNIGKPEDYRYANWRKEHGKNWWWWSFFQVFLLQGVILWIVSSVLLPALHQGNEFGVLDFIGIGLWAIGFFFEAVGDYQLTKFKKNPSNKGKVMNKGLWKYTRHPNYFGDATLWWGFFFLALGYPNGWYFIFAPLFMTLLLLKVSGVAMLEVKLKKSKPKYAEYIRRTSAFFPMPPKK